MWGGDARDTWQGERHGERPVGNWNRGCRHGMKRKDLQQTEHQDGVRHHWQLDSRLSEYYCEKPDE